tara:strand:- start:1003 stop:1605 length:603 start_codon:yes stop_codon:yes gene_type:complete
MPIAINGNGTITGVTVGGLPDGIVDTDMLAANAVSSAKLASGVGGKILQVVPVIKTSGFSVTASSGNFSDITGLSASITLTGSSNKVLILFQSSYSANIGQRGSFRLLRGSQVINAANADGQNTNQAIFASICTRENTSMSVPVAGCAVDTPGAGTHTYKLQVGAESSAATIFVNADASGGTGNTNYKGVSNLILLEVAA